MEKKHQQEEYVDFVVTARKYKTLLTAKYKSRPMWYKPSAGDVVSHLPGTIIKIMVEEGQAVEQKRIPVAKPARGTPEAGESRWQQAVADVSRQWPEMQGKMEAVWSLPYRESLSSSM